MTIDPQPNDGPLPFSPNHYLPKLSPRRREATANSLALKAAAANRPPSYGGGWGTYLPGQGFGPEGMTRDYAREAGRLDLNPLVRLIFDWYANAITQITFRVGRQFKKGSRKGEYEANAAHGLNRIFRRPCPVFSARETGAMQVAGLLLDGNTYGVIVEDNGGQPAEVWWVPNWQVEVVASDGRDPRRPIKSYRIHDLNGGWVEYPPERILHIRDLPDPRNPLIGIGRLKCFLPYLIAIESGGEYTNESLRKGNTGIVLMPPQGDTMGSYEEAEMLGHKRRIERGLARGGNTPVMFLTSHLVHEKIGLSPQEMTAETILDRPESYVLAAGGLSSMVLNLPSAMSGQTFANKAEASRAAWEDSAVPMFTLIAEAYQDQVLYLRDPDTGEEEGRFGDAPGLEVWADTSEVRALQENLQEKADLWVGLVDAGMVKREYAASQLDIPEEAIPDESELMPEEPEPFEPTEEELADEEEDEGESAAVGAKAITNGHNGNGNGHHGHHDHEPRPELLDALKAARGGGPSRRKKGGPSSPSSTPPNVSAAAARVARGEPSPGDQKLLRAWGKKQRMATAAGKKRAFIAKARAMHARAVERRGKAVVRTRADDETYISYTDRRGNTGDFTVARDKGEWVLIEGTRAPGSGPDDWPVIDSGKSRAKMERYAEDSARTAVARDAADDVMVAAMARVRVVDGKGGAARVVGPDGSEYRVVPHGEGFFADPQRPGLRPGLPGQEFDRVRASLRESPGHYLNTGHGPGYSVRDRDGDVAFFRPDVRDRDAVIDRAKSLIHGDLFDAAFAGRKKPIEYPSEWSDLRAEVAARQARQASRRRDDPPDDSPFGHIALDDDNPFKAAAEMPAADRPSPLSSPSPLPSPSPSSPTTTPPDAEASD